MLVTSENLASGPDESSRNKASHLRVCFFAPFPRSLALCVLLFLRSVTQSTAPNHNPWSSKEFCYRESESSSYSNNKLLRDKKKVRISTKREKERDLLNVLVVVSVVFFLFSFLFAALPVQILCFPSIFGFVEQIKNCAIYPGKILLFFVVTRYE
jgi:hypothetical protein